MATGYTAILCGEKEITFEKFVLTCARAFGALVTMREDPLAAPIPEKFEPSDWHQKELEKAQQRLKEIEGWDDEQARKEAEKAYYEALNHRNKSIAHDIVLRQRYENMLTKVQTWIPPTPDHNDLKVFMIQQLKSSIDFDCGYEMEESIKLSWFAYKAQRIEEVQRDINYHTKENEEEINRTRERNEWLSALRQSLA